MAISPVGKLESVSEWATQVAEIPDAQSVEASVRLVPRTRLFILSCDDEVIDLVRTAAGPTAQLACDRDLEHLLRAVPDSDPDVLIIDGANHSTKHTIEQVARHFPDAVTVIIGTPEESTELLQLAAVGRIFRFLLRPLSLGAVRLALAAAIARCAERKGLPSQRTAAVEVKPRKKRWVTLSVLAAASAVMIGGVWAAASLLKAQPQAPASAAASNRAPTLAQAAAPAPELEAARQQLVLADQALAEARVIGTGSALELYRGVLALDADNAAARDGIRAVAEQLLSRAEESIVAELLEDAQEALDLVRDIDAEYPRLEFLSTQLARERERGSLRQARLRRLVAEARNDIQTGNLLGWVSGGAVEALLEARKIDPRDPEVLATVRELTAALADAVRKAAATGDTQRARAYTTAAVRLGISRQVMAGMERALTESRLRDNAAASDVGSD